MSTSRDPDAPSVPGRVAIVFEALLGDGDAQLVYEGLYRLRELMVDALRVVQAEGLRPGGRPFEPMDFGIPQIDRLLARLGADPADDASPTEEC